MQNIYKETIEQVENGARFSVSFEKRSLKVNGKCIIKNGEYEGLLGCPETDNPLDKIENLYDLYRRSLPSQRSENKCRNYFRAIPEKDMTDEDMLYGTPREIAQCELELFILCQIITDRLKWDDFAKDLWFWQSPKYPSLILLKSWFNNYEQSNNS